ncbi:MAG TPA: UbiD family decarboxylase, partial [Spirochaetales bacterium]|nr:UbiD family decarboxylase [Spirochaetales bacterium]
MAYKDLQDFIRAIEARGELKRVAVEVDPRLEITEIAERVMRMVGA